MATVDVQVDFMVIFFFPFFFKLNKEFEFETGLQISWVFLCNNEYIYYRVTIVTVWFLFQLKEELLFFIFTVCF